MKVRQFGPADESDVIRLWTDCGLVRPWNDPRRDIARKLTEQPELFLVGEQDGTVMATVMAGFDGHRGWLYYLAVDPAHRGQSHGVTLVRTAEQLLLQRGCPKVNLMVRSDNDAVIEFYRHLDYKVDEVVVLSRRLVRDD